MPDALKRACSASPLCPNLSTGGPCPSCAKAKEAIRGSAASRGYNARWRAFKERVKAKLIALDISPCCGARLPTAPASTDSRCAEEDRQTFKDLHLDHIWPLSPEERTSWRAVCSYDRVQLLCRRCHSAKTLREQHDAA